MAAGRETAVEKEQNAAWRACRAAMNDPPITIKVHSAIAEIPAAEWDACAGEVNPTVSHVFLNALEESGSAVPRAGRAPQHLTFEDGQGRLVGAVPTYLKSHSYGEYVFD